MLSHSKIANRRGQAATFELAGQRFSDLREIFGGERNHCWSGTAECDAEKTGHARNRENFRETGDERLAIGLMQAILHGVPQQVVTPGVESCEK